LLSTKSFNVRARAPLRLGLAGGGTDLSPYCDEFGGVILNATIDRFAYAHVYTHPEGKLLFRADDIEVEETLDPSAPLDIHQGLVLHRAIYQHFMDAYCGGERLPLIVSTTVDVPAGSGLGASSALAVAIIEAFRVGLQLPLGPYDVARLAYQIERIDLKLAGGRQDQYAAAFGGVNYMEFLPGERVIVNPLRIRRDYLNEFESALVVCFTGVSRRSDTIIKEQVSGLKAMNAETLANMHQLKHDAEDMKAALQNGDLAAMSRILAHSWLAKKKTAAGISTSTVDALYEAALKAGAWGGKVSGAGGGGFLMLLTDPENRFRLITALAAAGGMPGSVKLSFDGAEGWAPKRQG